MPQMLAHYKVGAEEGGFETGIRLALQKILVSPGFLYRTERDPPSATPGAAYRVSDVELASRLSFFLWSSVPDDELLALAEKDQLHEPAVLKAQVQRMMSDSRSEALIKNFVGQWLFLRNVTRISPDTSTFMTFDENLRRSMAKETELLVESQVREDHPVIDLLSSAYTFLINPIPHHYRINPTYRRTF